MGTIKYLVCMATALALASSVTSAAADDGSDRKAAEQYIRASEAAWAESVPTDDSSVVKRILADDVVWVLDGEVLDKRAAIRLTEGKPNDFASNHLEYANVRIFGDMAVVQGSEAWAKKNGQKGHFIWTDTWLRRNGKWQIIAAEDVSVPAPAQE